MTTGQSIPHPGITNKRSLTDQDKVDFCRGGNRKHLTGPDTSSEVDPPPLTEQQESLDGTLLDWFLSRAGRKEVEDVQRGERECQGLKQVVGRQTLDL